MNAEQPRPRYSGVTCHEKKWLAKFRLKGRDLNLGHYEDPETAAWAADLARYLCYGLNPATWPPRVGRPNSPPIARYDHTRLFVIRMVRWATDLDSDLCRHIGEYERLANRAEYDAFVEQDAGR